MELKRDLGKAKFLVTKQFFYPFDLMMDDELLNGNALYLGKQVGQIRVIVT
jgi:hypothetical protein